MSIKEGDGTDSVRGGEGERQGERETEREWERGSEKGELSL